MGNSSSNNSDKSIERWNSIDNALFYENIPLETQQNYSVKGGLNDYCDLKLFEEHIEHANTILEVGACFGRVLDFLLQSKFAGNITAIERSQHFYDLLNKRYSNDVELLHADVSEYKTDKKYDLVLWMWSGISDFSKPEQLPVLSRLMSCISEGGFLIFDTFSCFDAPLNASRSNSQKYTIREKDCVLKGYIPSPKEISIYAELMGVKSIKHIPYKTTKNRPRSLFILQR